MTDKAMQPVAPAAKWNVLSIVSLVTSVIGASLVGIIAGELFMSSNAWSAAAIGASLVGIITGHIAMGQIKRTGEQGNVLAIIGLILGYLGLVIFVIFAIIWIGIVVAAGSAGVSGY